MGRRRSPTAVELQRRIGTVRLHRRLQRFRTSPPAGDHQLSEFFQRARLRWKRSQVHQEAALNFLRRISTRRLLSICALALVIVIGGTAAALATSGSDPKPPAKPLADAVHDALTAPTVPGISADIHFTNNLIDASSLEGKDPILAGASGRLWASPSGGGELRLELPAEETGN